MYAKELRDTPIKVNAANPGYCATDLNGHRGFREPVQGAEVSVHLATLPGRRAERRAVGRPDLLARSVGRRRPALVTARRR